MNNYEVFAGDDLLGFVNADNIIEALDKALAKWCQVTDVKFNGKAQWPLPVVNLYRP